MGYGLHDRRPVRLVADPHTDIEPADPTPVVFGAWICEDDFVRGVDAIDEGDHHHLVGLEAPQASR
jgi:hypothetical protein